MILNIIFNINLSNRYDPKKILPPLVRLRSNGNEGVFQFPELVLTIEFSVD